MMDALVKPYTVVTESLDIKQGKIKVLVLSIHYPFALACYFLTALRKRSDVDLRTVGPYTSNQIPWMGGMTLSPKYNNVPDIPLPQSMIGQTINYDLVKAQLGDWKPDIILNIDAGCHWSYRPSEGLVATVATDPHCLNYDLPRSYSDRFFNMQKCYSVAGDIYLPYAFSSYDHFPDPEILNDTDAVLIGMPYPSRIDWVSQLRARGVSVIFENGPIFDEARKLYNRGCIGLNWSSLQDTNARAFELAAMKLAPVMNYTPDMGTFFEDGEDFLGFSDLSQAVENVVTLKNNTQMRRNMAQKAFDKVQGQTYDARVEQILKECGFI